MVADGKKTALARHAVAANDARAENDTKDDREQRSSDTIIEDVESKAHSCLCTQKEQAPQLCGACSRNECQTEAIRLSADGCSTLRECRGQRAQSWMAREPS